MILPVKRYYNHLKLSQNQKKTELDLLLNKQKNELAEKQDCTDHNKYKCLNEKFADAVQHYEESEIIGDKISDKVAISGYKTKLKALKNSVVCTIDLTKEETTAKSSPKTVDENKKKERACLKG